METFYATGPIENLLKQVSGLKQFRKKHVRFFESLTGREVEVLTLIASGLKNPAIAKKLEISRTTVQNHRANIRDKLNIENQTDYMKYALAYDLIEF